MSALWMGLRHAAYEMARRLSANTRRHAGPCCARCGGTGGLKSRNCCKVVLCGRCSASWREATAANDFRCVICRDDVVCA